jgi:hypothetical protein
MSIHIDFTNPATARALAAMPFDGQAAALIRRVDPYWKIDLPAEFDVVMERGKEKSCPTCGCDCGNFGDFERKSVTVFASSEDEAEELALQEFEGWVVFCVTPPKPPEIKIPDELLRPFERAQP